MQEESPDTILADEENADLTSAADFMSEEAAEEEADIEDVLAELESVLEERPADSNGSGELTEGVAVVFDSANEKPEPSPEVSREEEIRSKVSELLQIAAERCSTTTKDMRGHGRSIQAVRARWAAGQTLRQAGVPITTIREALDRGSETSTYQMLRSTRPDAISDLRAIRERFGDWTYPEAPKAPEPFDRTAAERLVVATLNYFGTDQAELSKVRGNKAGMDARWVSAQLLRRLKIPKTGIRDLLHRPSIESVYQISSRRAPELHGAVEEIWEGFQNGEDFSERARRIAEARAAAARPEPEPEEPPALSGEEIDRLILTTANYVGVRPEQVIDSRKSRPEAVLARIIVLTLLEEELGMRRKHVAKHFNRAAASVTSTLRNDNIRHLLLNNQRARSGILKAFKAGDTLEERGEELLREQREKARKEGKEPPYSREVPAEERELFERFSEGKKDAIKTVEDAYLQPVQDAMRKRLEGSAIGLPEQKPLEVLHLTARNFAPVAERHRNFKEWALRVARQEAEEMLETERQKKKMREVDTKRFFTETYEAYRSGNVRASMARAIEFNKEDGKRVMDTAKSVYAAAAEASKKKLPIPYYGFQRLIKLLNKTNVILQDPERSKGKIPAESLARQVTLGEFEGEKLEELLGLLLESAVRDVGLKLGTNPGPTRKPKVHI